MGCCYVEYFKTCQQGRIQGGGWGGSPPTRLFNEKLPPPGREFLVKRGNIGASPPLSREYCQRGKIWVPPPLWSRVWSEGKNLPPPGREFHQRGNPSPPPVVSFVRGGQFPNFSPLHQRFLYLSL